VGAIIPHAEALRMWPVGLDYGGVARPNLDIPFLTVDEHPERQVMVTRATDRFSTVATLPA
jgi:hypothetical protein